MHFYLLLIMTSVDMIAKSSAVSADFASSSFGEDHSWTRGWRGTASAIDLMRGETDDQTRARVESNLSRLEALHERTLPEHLELMQHGQLAPWAPYRHVQDVYLLDAASSGHRNIPFFEQCCRDLRFQTLHLDDHRRSPMRFGFPNTGIVDLSDSLWEDQWPRNCQRHPSGEARVRLDTLAATFASGTTPSELLQQHAVDHPVDFDEPPPTDPSDPGIWDDGWLEVSPMIDGTRMIRLPAGDPREKAFSSRTHFVRQRWNRATGKFEKLRVIGDDKTKNELVNLKAHGLDLRSHRELTCQWAYGRFRHWKIPLLQTKRDVLADFARERQARIAAGRPPGVRWYDDPISTLPSTIAEPISKEHITLFPGKVDLAAAYFQLPVARSYGGRDNLVRCWDPAARRWALCDSRVQTFGNRWSSFCWTSVSRVYEEVLNVLGIPNSSYIDDFILWARQPLCRYFLSVALRVMWLFGTKVSSKRDGVIEGGANKVVEVLGLDYCVRTMTALGDVMPPRLDVTAPQQKQDALVEAIDHWLADHTSDEQLLQLNVRTDIRGLQRIVGIAGFVCWNSIFAPQVDSLSRIWTCLRPYDHWCERRVIFLPSSDLATLADALTELRGHAESDVEVQSIDDNILRRGRAAVYTDAMLDSRRGIAGLGGILDSPCGQRFAFTIHIRPCRATIGWHIGSWELLAFALACYLWNRWLRDHRLNVSAGLDNTGTVFNWVKGTSHNVIDRKIVRASKRHNRDFGILYYVSWLSTVRNPADDPSRLPRSLIVSQYADDITFVSTPRVIDALRQLFSDLQLGTDPLIDLVPDEEVYV